MAVHVQKSRVTGEFEVVRGEGPMATVLTAFPEEETAQKVARVLRLEDEGYGEWEATAKVFGEEEAIRCFGPKPERVEYDDGSVNEEDPA